SYFTLLPYTTLFRSTFIVHMRSTPNNLTNCRFSQVRISLVSQSNAATQNGTSPQSPTAGVNCSFGNRPAVTGHQQHCLAPLHRPLEPQQPGRHVLQSRAKFYHLGDCLCPSSSRGGGGKP